MNKKAKSVTLSYFFFSSNGFSEQGLVTITY